MNPQATRRLAEIGQHRALGVATAGAVSRARPRLQLQAGGVDDHRAVRAAVDRAGTTAARRAAGAAIA